MGIVITTFSLAFSIFTQTVKKTLKTTRSKKEKHNKLAMLPRSKLNSIKRKISEGLINTEIINEEKEYRELKESIRMMNSQRNDTEKINAIEEGKKMGILEVIKRNEIINKSLKSQT